MANISEILDQSIQDKYSVHVKVLTTFKRFLI